MSRDYKLFMEDILASIRKIKDYTSGMSQKDLNEDQKTLDAVVRNFEIIGEAIKILPPSIHQQRPEIEWKKVAAFGDVLIQNYFGIDMAILWDIIHNELPVLERNVESILRDN